ncbi:MAG: valine--tRNA ligase [Pseudomonadota bacterium]
MDKTFDARTEEPRLYAAWEAAGAFAAGANASRDETFSILLPPPNVTGVLHMGHAFNQTLMDVLIRWHRMRGFDTLWQPGLDHAGIATQMVVERELAKTNMRRTDFSRADFTAKVWEWKAQSGGTIVNQSKALGASMDWSRSAFTMGGAPGGGEAEPGPNFHDAVLKTFVEMYEKGLIYRGKRLVNWDPHFETAISDLEVENTEIDGHMWHFKYPLAGGETYEYVERDENGVVTLRETRDYISIATTRPETMLGDGAVAVHPSDARYAPIVGKLCEIPVGPKDQRRLIPIITDAYPDPDFGSGAVKITGAHDFNDYDVAKRGNIPMYRLMDTKGDMRTDGAPYAEAAAIAQGIAEGKREWTPEFIDTLNLVPDDLRGLHRFHRKGHDDGPQAREHVVRQITEEGLAVTVPNPEWDTADEEGRMGLNPVLPLVEQKKIMAPYGDRSKVIIEPMLTDQWFVATDKIVGPALDAVRAGETEILPEQHRKVYFNWLENIEPWCISRQLWWGHQIPVWYGPDPSEPFSSPPKFFCASNWSDAKKAALDLYERAYPDSKVSIEEFSPKDDSSWPKTHRDYEDIRAMGLEGFEELYPHSKLEQPRRWRFSGSMDPRTGNRSITIKIGRDPDVLDTWFSSGLWPLGTLGWPDDTPELKRYYPTSVLITGFDIIFFWVARMMMMQQAMLPDSLPRLEKIPFKTVYVHALVRDEKGKKMSKSLGNVLDPLELIDEYGADAVRFTLTAMAAMGRDLKLSVDRIKGYRNFGTKLWNAIRFAEMNEAYANGSQTHAIRMPDACQTANKWIIGETARARESLDAALGAYRFNDAANGLYAHVWGRVCDWYIEFAKPLLASEDDEIVQETRATMAWALDQCLILLHPVMPFITEKLWGETAERTKMLIHADWPDYTETALADAAADAEMSWVINLIEDIRSVRSETHVPAGAKIQLVQIDLDADGQGALDRNRALIERLARIEAITRADTPPKGAVTIPVRGGTFCLPLADVIDLAAERARLTKARGKLDKEISGLQAKLGNAKFVANAPEEVVDEARARLEDLEAEATKLAAAQTRLQELA